MAGGNQIDIAEADGASPDIFVSYSRTDEADARKLITYLQGEGFSVWWDGMLQAGTLYTATTEQALAQARAVLVVWSKRSVESHWVRDEAQDGRETGRLVPVTFDGTQPPLGFRQFQSVDLSAWRGGTNAPEIRNVRDALARLTANGAGAATPDKQPVYRSAAQTAVQTGAVPRVAVVALGIFLTILLAVAGWSWLRSGTEEVSNSIAILPFDNLSDDPDQAYFSTGLAEELRQVLGQDGALQVAARTSSEEAAGSGEEAQVVAAALGVRYLLDGSVRRAGNVVRVSVQLIDGSTGFDVWSHAYERSLDDIFAVQSDIAGNVAQALHIRVRAGDGSLSARRGGTENAAAYDAYLRGKALYDLALDEATDRAAQRQFETAVEADPDYGAAWAALARVQTLIANSYAGDRPLAEAYAEAVTSARTAVEVAPDLPASQVALGFTLFNGRLDATAAQEPFREAHRLGMGDADLLQVYATYAARVGDFASANEAIRNAVRLDPLNAVAKRSEATILYAEGDYAAARTAALAALDLNPDMRVTHRILGDILYLQGDYTGAVAEYRLEGSALSSLTGLAMTLPKLGEQNAARVALTQLRSRYGDNALYQQAQVFAQTGQSEQALDALEAAFAANDAGLVLMRNDPLFTPLRGEPRFNQLLQRMGFTLPD